MCMTKQFIYPDINKAYIGASNRTMVCDAYISALNETGVFYNNQYAYKLHEFNAAEKNKPLLRSEYDCLVCFIEEWSKIHSIYVDIIVRLKDWMGYNAKIRLFQSEGRCLDSIRDLLGFKLVLRTEFPDSERTHKLCYQLMNDVLTFLTLSRHCLLLKAEAKTGNPLDPSSDVAKKIFVYTENEIAPTYVEFVKNYLANPKDDGYQGLHACLKTLSGLFFEIQVHTVATNLHAQILHQTYKDGRYANVKFDIDFKKINIPGLVFDENGKILYDTTGLFLSDFNFLYR